jgi:polyisoprenoid-binding protein YceI
MQRILVLAFAAAAAAAPLALAEGDAGKTYRFGAATKHTNVTFTSEAEVENIYGITNTVSGSAWLDFEALKGKCSISVPVKSLDTRIELRNEHLRSETWLDEKKYPDITLASEGFDLTEKNKDKGIYQAAFKGKLTIHGVTKDLETTARVIKIAPDMTKMLGEGEWVRVIASFDVTLKDFDITIPDGPVVAKVSPTWTVKFDCYATTAEEKKEGR